MIKKPILVAMVLMLSVLSILVLFGCQQTTAAEAQTTAAEAQTTAAEAQTTAAEAQDNTSSTVSGKKFAICALYQTNEWNFLVTEAIKKVLTDAGNEVTLTDAVGDIQKQSEDLISIVATKPDVIFVTLGDNVIFRKGIEAAADAGIPIIDVEAHITGPSVKTHLWADQLVNGIKNANNIVEYLASVNEGVVKGNVIDVHTPADATVDIRRNAGLMKLEMYPDINFITSVAFDKTNSMEDSRAKVTAYLQAHADEVDVITAYYGETTTGATMAVDALGLGDKIKVVGIDAFEPVLQLMREGKPVISAVQQDGYAMGTVAAKLAMKILNGEEVSWQYVLPLTDIYCNFPGKADNFPSEGGVKITCPQEFKDAGIGWDY